MSSKNPVAATKNPIAEIAPKLVQRSDEVPFDDVWERPMTTHLAFYSGRRSAYSAIRRAKELFDEKPGMP